MFDFIPVPDAIEAYLPDIIAEAEKWCGKRGSRYQEPTVEFVSDERAPYTHFDPVTGAATKICLNSGILQKNPEEALEAACCECAHELVHCIAPCPPGTPHPCGGHSMSTVLEEGLATLFQAYYHDMVMGITPPFMEKYNYEALAEYRHYGQAAKLVQRLLKEKPGAIETLRSSLPEEAEECIGLIGYDDIKRVFKDLDDILARDLAKPLIQLKEENARLEGESGGTGEELCDLTCGS